MHFLAFYFKQLAKLFFQLNNRTLSNEKFKNAKKYFVNFGRFVTKVLSFAIFFVIAIRRFRASNGFFGYKLRSKINQSYLGISINRTLPIVGN